MFQPRKIRLAEKSKPTLEGAGVRLRRAFGNGSEKLFDPFLLLDDFRGDEPDDYMKGFPWHPHRGIETITYMLRGEIAHGDSLGNQGTVTAGDVQWMTAGSGIIHQEMPKGDFDGRMYGFQLWANLPREKKMLPPRYQNVKEDQIPMVIGKCHERIRVICGEVDGQRGPVQGIATDPVYLDVNVPACTQIVLPTKAGHTVVAYVYKGSANFDRESGTVMEDKSLILFDEGDSVLVSTGAEPVRFLFFTGMPIREPIAWYGPIVMNTEEELRTAYDEYQQGTFIK
jgi:redox-sensitive bicupin YhaK (pirin superfamily)